MRVVSRGSTPGFAEVRTTDLPSYSVLVFATRSAAVRYCLDVSDVLTHASGSVGQDADRRATVWLAVSPGSGSFQVFACDRALAAAHSAGIEAVVARRIASNAMPVARCLVIGDRAMLTTH